MTAEGTACNGAGEAPRAEFAPEKAAPAPPEEKAAGEDVGGPFVIVNGGDSDGHSDRGSDLGKAPDEDSPSEEEDAPGSNAAPDAPAGGDHGPAGGEAPAPGAATGGASSADGCDRAADGSEGGADEGEAEPISEFGAEVAQQEAVGEEDGGAAALASSGRDPAISGADSEAPAVDSEVESKEYAVDGGAVTDAAETVVQETDVRAPSCPQDTTPASAIGVGSEAPAVDSEFECKEHAADGGSVTDAAETVVVQEAEVRAPSCPQDTASASVIGVGSEAPAVDSEVEGKEHASDGGAVTNVAETGVQEADLRAPSCPQDTASSSVFGVGSEAPPADSEVEGKEYTADGGAVTDVAETVVQEEEVRAPSCPQVTASASAIGIDSEAPAVNSEVEGKEHAVDGGAVTDVAEAVVQEASSTEQDGEDADEVSCGHDDALAPAKSGCAAAESNLNGEDLKQSESVADVVEPVEQGTEGASALVEKAHLCADVRDDSFVAATTEPEAQEDVAVESCGHDYALPCNESAAMESDAYVEDCKEEEQNTSDSVEVMKDTCLMANGHLCVDTRSDSSEPDSHANEGKLEQRTTEITDSVEGDVSSSADSCIVVSDSKVHAIEMEEQETDQQMEAPTTEAEVLEGVLKATNRNCAVIVDASGHSSVEGSVDASGEQEAMDSQVEGEATCGVLQLEGVGVVCSNEQIELPVEEGINEALPDVGESEEVIKAEDGVSIGATHSKPSNPSLDSNLENMANGEVAKIIEIAAESDLNDENVVETACEVEETEVKELGYADQANEVDNDVVHAVPLQETASSTFPNQPSPDLVDYDSINCSSPATVLESFDNVHTEDSRSREICKSTVEQLVCGASLVAGEAETTLTTRNGLEEKPSDIGVDQDGPIDLIVKEHLVVDDAHLGLDDDVSTLKKDESSAIVGDNKSLDNQSEICNASTASDECSSIIGNKGSSIIGNEGSSPQNEVACLSDESCNVTSSDNVNISTKSSDTVETKCLEALDSPSVGTVVPAEQKDADAQVMGQQRMYIIKIPRFTGEDIWAKMEAAQAHLDQLTQERDAVNHRRQKQKAVCDQYREKLDAARRVEREARTAHGDKKNDLNSVRSVLGKLHQANSIEEIDELIVAKERTMQHETISLKEEKLLIKEINDLKAQRKQLSSNMGSKAEINEAFDQRDHIHERHKELKKDSDVLFTNLRSLEENTRKIKKSYEEEKIALRKLMEEHQAANEIRQKAYSEWSELKQEPFKKNKYFFMYRDDRKNAENFRTSGDMYGLKSYCDNQIEKVMEMWNTNDDFRRQYVESNKVSTLRRLGTHDGRRLGPDEDPPVIPSRRPSNLSSLTSSSPQVPTLTSIPAPTLAAPALVEDSFPALPAPQISKHAKSKASGSSAQIENSAVAVSEAEDVKQTEKEKARLMEEQLELARKAEELARKEEELRKERIAAEKEQLRLEQKAKAKEAEERKRRRAEKDKERAEFKARREAEEREKEREKKKAKKDKRKGTAPAESSANGDGNAAALATADTDSNASYNLREVEVPQPSAPKKLSRPAAAIKQLNRVQPMPAPLRNRGRRKMRQYILIAVAVLSVLALFVAGNYIPRLKSVHF